MIALHLSLLPIHSESASHSVSTSYKNLASHRTNTDQVPPFFHHVICDLELAAQHVVVCNGKSRVNNRLRQQSDTIRRCEAYNRMLTQVPDTSHSNGLDTTKKVVSSACHDEELLGQAPCSPRLTCCGVLGVYCVCVMREFKGRDETQYSDPT